MRRVVLVCSVTGIAAPARDCPSRDGCVRDTDGSGLKRDFARQIASTRP